MDVVKGNLSMRFDEIQIKEIIARIINTTCITTHKVSSEDSSTKTFYKFLGKLLVKWLIKLIECGNPTLPTFCISEEIIVSCICVDTLLKEAVFRFENLNKISRFVYNYVLDTEKFHLVDSEVQVRKNSSELSSIIKRGEHLRFSLQNEFTSSLSCDLYLRFSEERQKASFLYKRDQIFDKWLDFVLSMPLDTDKTTERIKFVFDTRSKSLLAYLLTTAEELRNAFNEGLLKTVESRKHYLKKLWEMVDNHENEMINALKLDLNKSSYDSYLYEISQIRAEISHIYNNLVYFVSDQKVSTSFLFMLDSSYIQKQPFGVCLILGAWNYPLNLILQPLIGAIAAGNTVLIKPSELAPNSAELVSKIIPRYLDDVCKVFCGGPKETSELLNNTRFDIILYTGSSRVGKLVMAAAAKFLTPVILELGGKSPVYVDNSANIDMAATRICWAKFMNCGQTCVAPDYILCHEDIYEEFIEAVADKVEQFYGKNVLKSKDYGRIINLMHTKRLRELITKTKGKVVIGGEVNEENKFVSPCVIRNVKLDDVLMEDEIFGPLMPVIKVKSSQEAIEIVNRHEKPLALYVFTTTSSICNNWLANTTSGGFVHNDCAMHLANPNLPFGGVGNSGMGNYHGKYSIDSFSHKRAVLLKSSLRQTELPPYAANTEGWGRWFTKTKITDSYCNIM